MKASAQNLCNNILIRAHKEKIEVSPMKLQKLLYYICVMYVQKTYSFPILERFEVWRYGPVIPSVYTEFKPFGSTPIKGFALNSKGKAMIVDEDINPVIKTCINYVWDKYKHFSAITLAEKTHQRGSGCYYAFQENREIISMEDMFNDTTI